MPRRAKMPANPTKRPRGRPTRPNPVEVVQNVPEPQPEPDPLDSYDHNLQWCTDGLCDIPSNIKHLAHPEDFARNFIEREVIREPGETGFGEESKFTPRSERQPVSFPLETTITRPD